MLAEVIRALDAALAATVLPGYGWTRLLRPAARGAELIAWSIALSLASVPVVAVALAWASGGGVGLWVAVAAVVAVTGAGLVAWRARAGGTLAWLGLARPDPGPPPGPEPPVLPPPSPIRDPARLTVLVVALGVALAVALHPSLPGRETLVIAVGVIAAGVLAAWPRGAPEASPAAAPGWRPVFLARPPLAGWAKRPWLPGTALGTLLAAPAGFAYVGVISHDWPYLPGGDQYSYAVMTEQMLLRGQFRGYLIYPPGFPAITAVVCRLSGLTPLALNPVLAPALLVLPPLAAYVLATRLWGRGTGLVAAALAGMVFTGGFASFIDGRYPDLVAASFLLVMAVAALVRLYSSADWRASALTVTVAAAVSLFHQVTTLYLAGVLVIALLAGLPWLLLTRRRREAALLAITLTGVAALSACYAAYSYDLPAMLRGGSPTSAAVTAALGSQPPTSLYDLPTSISPPVMWFGLLGLVVMMMGIRWRRDTRAALVAVTMAGWCLLMFAGSRTALDGFPQRFARDIGVPLAVAAALGVTVLARSVASQSRAAGRTWVAMAGLAVAGVAVAVGGLAVGTQVVRNVVAETNPVDTMTPLVAEAGHWLDQHHADGSIIATHALGPQVGSRAALALGWYTGLQSFSASQTAHPRSLPTAGRGELLDSARVLEHPAGCAAEHIMVTDHVRYLVVYRLSSGVNLRALAGDRQRFPVDFQNSTVIIYGFTPHPCAG